MAFHSIQLGTARYCLSKAEADRRMAARRITSSAYRDQLRSDIRRNRELIAANPDDAYRVDQWRFNIKVWKNRYRLESLQLTVKRELPQ